MHRRSERCWRRCLTGDADQHLTHDNGERFLHLIERSGLQLRLPSRPQAGGRLLSETAGISRHRDCSVEWVEYVVCVTARVHGHRASAPGMLLSPQLMLCTAAIRTSGGGCIRNRRASTPCGMRRLAPAYSTRRGADPDRQHRFPTTHWGHHAVIPEKIVCTAPQGVRIDYVLASQGLLDKIMSCEVILDLPPKWCVLPVHTPPVSLALRSLNPGVATAGR